MPEGKLYSVPEPELVIDDSQIILHDVFGGSDGLGYFFVLQAFGNEVDDSVFTFTWHTVPIASICRHACLRYNKVASFTRLIPPVIPKRRNSRLKWAFTVRLAISSWVAISVLSQPCKSSSTTCCSRGPSRTVCSFISFPSFCFNPFSRSGARLTFS